MYHSHVVEVVHEAEGALPEVGSLVLDWLSSVQDFSHQLASDNTHHCTRDQLAFVEAVWGLSRQQNELLLL